MSHLVFGLVTGAAPGRAPADDKRREMTIAWSRYGYRGPIIEGATINLVLNTALLQGHAFCLVQRAGHVIDETWYPPGWGRKGFHAILKELIRGPAFLVRGTWHISDGGYPGLRDDCLLVDLRTYKALGRPDFGHRGEQPTRPLAVPQISPEAFALLPSSERYQGVPAIAGWRFIARSLEHGLAVRRFPAAFDNARRDLAHDAATPSDALGNLLARPVSEWANADLHRLSAPQRAFLDGIRPQLCDARRGVFLWNIESYDDIETVVDRTPPDAVVAVAAGFKPNRILHGQGFTDSTEVHFVDYSEQALRVRQCLVEEWDGEDFPTFLHYLFRRFPHPQTFYQLWAGVTPESLDWDDVASFWQLELKRWGGATAFKMHWQKYRTLPHKYTVCNLLTEGSGFAAQLRHYQQPYLWWSNAFFTVHSNWFYTTAQRKRFYEQWIRALTEANPRCIVNGADYNNQAVNGVRAADYCHAYFAQPCDELTPKQINRVQLRF